MKLEFEYGHGTMTAELRIILMCLFRARQFPIRLIWRMFIQLQGIHSKSIGMEPLSKLAKRDQK